ncbi:GAP family protein [Cellulosimicrobium protaetiae]
MASDALTPALPAALAMLTSPMAIAAMIVLLLSRRGRVNATAFAVGWFAAVGAAVVVAALVRPTLPDGGAGSGAVSLVLGGVLLVLAVVVLVAVLVTARRRDAATEPRWWAVVDSVRPGRAVVLAVLLGTVAPKNLVLVVVGGTAIGGRADGDLGATLAAAAAFAVIASVGVAAPLVVSVALGVRGPALLTSLRGWLSRNDGVVVAVVLGLVGVQQIGAGSGWW